MMIGSQPPPSSRPLSATTAVSQKPSTGTTAASLPGLLKSLGIEPKPEKPLPGMPPDAPLKYTYKPSTEEFSKVLQAKRGDTVSLVEAMVDPSAPDIELTRQSLLDLTEQLGEEGRASLRTLEAFSTLLAPYEGTELEGPINDAFNRGEARTKKPKE